MLLLGRKRWGALPGGIPLLLSRSRPCLFLAAAALCLEPRQGHRCPSSLSGPGLDGTAPQGSHLGPHSHSPKKHEPSHGPGSALVSSHQLSSLDWGCQRLCPVLELSSTCSPPPLQTSPGIYTFPATKRETLASPGWAPASSPLPHPLPAPTTHHLALPAESAASAIWENTAFLLT